jgi:uncharacterized membrane protein
MKHWTIGAIIVFICIIVGFTACEFGGEKNDGDKKNDGDSTLTIVNRNAFPITEIKVGEIGGVYFLHEENLSITTSQTFPIEISGLFSGLSVLYLTVRVYAEGLSSANTVGFSSEGSKVTLYLTPSGHLSTSDHD